MRRLSPDDWGFSPAINDAALELAGRGWAHTVSVSVRGAFVRHRLDELRRFQEAGLVRVALHLDLSDAGAGASRLFRGGGALEAEVLEQLSRFEALGLRLESVNGHRHVQLYPAVFPLVARLGIPVRLMADPSHLRTFLPGRIWALSSQVRWERAGYLLPADLRSGAAFSAKLRRFPQVICHPAVKFDFAGMKDRLRGERVDEYRRILHCAGEAGGEASA